MASIQKITPNLWFDYKAEEAVEFYTSIFLNSSIGAITRYSEHGVKIHNQASGTVMTIAFQLDGQEFMALNGGPQFTFNEAISFVVNCKSQEEIDFFWEKLSKGSDPKTHISGWLKDKFGVSWQIVPVQLSKMLQDPDGDKTHRVMQAVWRMKKIDLQKLQQAFDAS